MRKKRITPILPVLFGFYVMGFCDVVGIATTYIKEDFKLTETIAGFVPSMVFLWFLLLSVPVALIMNRIGRKATVQMSNIITMVGMMIPFFAYNFTTCMIAFALLGIGNTMLQVSLNPLLTNVVEGDSLTSSLTAGQVVKAISSFMGPLIAAFAVNIFGNWQYLFPIFALITLLSTVWLLLTNIPRENIENRVISYANTFSLLKDKRILICFLGIIFTVGLDVGMNTLTPKLLIERCGLNITNASFGSSIYFLCRTAGAFIGAFILAKINDVKYFRINLLILIFATVTLLFIRNYLTILIFVGVYAYALSCIFPIIYSLALKARPEKGNEISGLLITGVCGGAIIPPFMGWMTDLVGSQAGSITVLIIGAAYLIFCSFNFKAEPLSKI